ncbi:hypothetical protein JCM17960_07820 [Magnetospira thiophila]
MGFEDPIYEDYDVEPEVCSKGLRKYFFVIATAAMLILIGVYWYTNYYTTGKMPGLQGIFQGGPVDAAMANGKKTGPQAPVNAAFAPVAMGGLPTMEPDGTIMGNGMPTFTLPSPGPTNPALGAPSWSPTLPDQRLMTTAAGGKFSHVVVGMRNSVTNVTIRRPGGILPGKAAADPNPEPAMPRFQLPFSGQSLENVGSGVIIRNDGYVVTNYHVVRGADSVFVTVFDNGGTERYPAEIVKLDQSLDLALLKISPKAPLVAAMLGDSTQVSVADEVVAIGSPFGLDQTVSRGIISGQRNSLVIENVTHKDLLQTDAAINQGNSGGALVNVDGEVIGINTAIYTPTGAFSGIGFAIPSNQVKTFVLEEINFLNSVNPVAQLSLNVAQRGGGQPKSGPPILSNQPAPHTDGREQMNCTICHDIIPANQAGGAPVGNGMMPVAAQPKSGPPILANQPAPHTDGREQMNCTICHDIIPANQAGGAPVAFPMMTAAAQPKSGPPIRANQPAPHRDGREQMNCTICHDILPMGGGQQVRAAPVAAPQGMAAPTITAGMPAPHADGREKMDCKICHQIVAAGGLPVAAPAPGNQSPFSYAQAPNSLARNVIQGGNGNGPCGMAVAQGNAAGTAAAPCPGGGQAGGPRNGYVILGAVVQPVTQVISQALGHPEGKGVFVPVVVKGSAADKAGIKSGDIILKADGRRVSTPRQLAAILRDFPRDQKVRISLERNGKRKRVNLMIAAPVMGNGVAQEPMTAQQQMAQQNQPGTAQQQMAQMTPPMTADQMAARLGQPQQPARVPTEFNWLGMEIEAFMPAKGAVAPNGQPIKGASIAEVTPMSRAQKGGILANDIVLQVNNTWVPTAEAFNEAMTNAQANGNAKQVMLRVNRDGSEFLVVV